VFDRLNVDYDFFVRTTRLEHVAAVAEVLRRLWDKGLIVKKMYKGLYCVGCEQFKKPSDLDEEGRCPDHVIVPVESEEENYFLVLAPFQEWLVRFISERDDVIAPSFFRREILAMLEEPLDDLSISRPKSRVSLGVDLPFDSAYVTYVWFDALINYVSSLGWPQDHERVATWWPSRRTSWRRISSRRIASTGRSCFAHSGSSRRANISSTAIGWAKAVARCRNR
jgi:methionyl-tRNA synthetase